MASEAKTDAPRRSPSASGCWASSASRRPACARAASPAQPVRLDGARRGRAQSDVDLLIEPDPAARLGLSDLLDLQEDLGELLARPINFAFASEMRPWLREWIEDDRIEIF